MPRTRKKVAAKKEAAPANELKAVIGQIQKEFGKGTIHKASQRPQPDRISTGSFMLDLATLGGIPHSASTLLIGDKHAGKTMVASKIIASAQRQFPDQQAVLIDIEGTYDPVWGEQLGVDNELLEISNPDTGEMASDLADAIVGSKEVSLVVVDSLAMLLPTVEAESSADDAHVGLQARLINRLVRKMTGSMVRERKRGHGVTIVFLNQWRTKIGGYSPTGDPRTMPGGRAVEHHSSLSITLKNKENKGKDALGIDTVTYNEHPYTINKNKGNNGPRTGEFTLIRDDDNEFGLAPGEIENASTMVTYAKKYGVWSGGGSSWRLKFLDYDVKAKRAADIIAKLYDDPDLFWALWVHMIQLQAANMGQKKDFIERIPGFYE